jgi:O-antigen ligase
MISVFRPGQLTYVLYPAHNLYLEVLSEQGISGVAALGFLLASGLSAGRNLRRSEVREAQILGYGAFAGLAGFCLAAAIELTFLRQWVVIMMFLLLGVISRLSSSQKKTKEVKECFLIVKS